MIIISPYARMLRSGEKNHPKNYPYWNALIPMIRELDSDIVQVGSGSEEALPGIKNLQLLSLVNLASLINHCKTWVSVDSFFQHLAWDEGKQGIVLWGPSDPLIFGHPENINLLKDRSYLVENQFIWWEATPHSNARFVEPQKVIEHLRK